MAASAMNVHIKNNVVSTSPHRSSSVQSINNPENTSHSETPVIKHQSQSRPTSNSFQIQEMPSLVEQLSALVASCQVNILGLIKY